MGLPGLLCAKLGARHVLLTDYEPVVVAQIQQNAEQNAVAARCACLALDWFDLAPLAPEQRHAFDLLLLADVIYAAAVVGPLVATLRTLLRPQTGERQRGPVTGRGWASMCMQVASLLLARMAQWPSWVLWSGSHGGIAIAELGSPPLARDSAGPCLPPSLPCSTGVALVAHRIRRPLIFDREENIAKLQVCGWTGVEGAGAGWAALPLLGF